MSKVLNTFSLMPWEKARWADMNGNQCCELLHAYKDFAHTVPHMRLKNNPERERQLCYSTPGFRESKGSWGQWVAKSRFVSSSVTLRPKFRAGYHDTLTPVISVKRPRQLPNSDLPKMQAEGQTRRRALRMPTQKTKGCYSCQTTQVFSEICALDFVGTRIGKVWEYTPLIASLPTNPSPLTLEWWSLLCWRCWVPCRCS